MNKTTVWAMQEIIDGEEVTIGIFTNEAIAIKETIDYLDGLPCTIEQDEFSYRFISAEEDKKEKYAIQLYEYELNEIY